MCTSIFYACMYCNHAVQYPQRPEDPWNWSCRLFATMWVPGAERSKCSQLLSHFSNPLYLLVYLLSLLIGSWAASIFWLQ